MKKTITLLTLTAVSLTAFGQDKKLSLDEVNVTATKFAKQSSETGKVVSIISREELERSGGKNINDLLNIQSSLTLNGANSNRGINISTFLRGAPSGYVLILIDGIPVNDPSQISNDYDLNLISLEMIDHIEILRGGHSTLYGSDAMAGVINIITKKGGDKPVSLNALLTGGSYNTFKQNLGVNGRFKKVDYNFSLTNEDSKGFSSAQKFGDTGEFDNDDFHLKAINANLGWAATSNLMIRPFVRYSDSKTMIDYGAFTDDKDYKGKSSELASGFTSNLKLNSADLFFNYSYNNVKRYFLNDSITGPQEYSLSDMKGQLHNAEVYSKFNLSNYIELLTGTSYHFANTNQISKYISPYWQSTSELNGDSAKNSIASVYASFFLKNLYGFNFEGGARFNHHSIYGNNFTYTINPSFLVDENTKLFVNISSAFKAPSLYQLYSIYGDKNLSPEKATTYEAGFQTVFSDGTVKVGLNAFRRDGKDVIAFTNKYVNYNKQKDRGMEVETEVIPVKDLTLKAFYSLVYGKVTTQNATFNNLYRRPRNSFGLNLGYKVNDNFFVSTNLKITGERIDPYFDSNTYQSTNLTLKSYALLDAYAEYKLLKKLKLFADIKNITDEKYVEITGYNTRGFNFSTGLSLSL
ncbi:TonB-dependent receptor plug domain-containing protein [Solitalea lacus]|uniref:TonB-dependent receptor plug domain-containing protein n=1 Tax=Solitalea lacus TaxID=2911172 RepID=UPI001EDB780F|nr:TonB-dependent receptor [Solitalea lacus]UKJ06284.1 TonB-dependent receptor [Solitalea lacus]